MILGLAFMALMAGDPALDWMPPEFRETPQQETGIPIYPFSELNGGFIQATFPAKWGLRRSVGKWVATGIVGGEWGDLQFMGRFKFAQWASIDVEEFDHVPVPPGFVARIRAMMVEGSVDYNLGVVRVGGTVGAGKFVIEDPFGSDRPFAIELGPYARLQPVEWLAVEAGVMGTMARTDFNERSLHWDFILTFHATVGVQLRF